MMKLFLKFSFVIASILFLVNSCGKDPVSEGCGAPIVVISPTTEPANISNGAPINYKVCFTYSDYIDSIYIYTQLDTSGTSYLESKDSIFMKQIYPVGTQKNVQQLEGIYRPTIFPQVGGAVHMTFRMFSKTRTSNKRVRFNVI